MGSPWNEPRGEHLPKAWIVRSPSDPHQSRHRSPSGKHRRKPEKNTWS
jgi:hypothetical protein